MTHSSQRREPGLAWAYRSAGQSFSRTAADCGPLVFPRGVQIFSSVYRRLPPQAALQPEKFNRHFLAGIDFGARRRTLRNPVARNSCEQQDRGRKFDPACRLCVFRSCKQGSNSRFAWRRGHFKDQWPAATVLPWHGRFVGSIPPRSTNYKSSRPSNSLSFRAKRGICIR